LKIKILTLFVVKRVDGVGGVVIIEMMRNMKLSISSYILKISGLLYILSIDKIIKKEGFYGI